MPTFVARTGIAALLLAAGCTAHSAQPHQRGTGHFDRTVAISLAPSSGSATPSSGSAAVSSGSATSSAPAASSTPAPPSSVAPSGSPAPSRSTVPVSSSTTSAAPRTQQVVRRPVTGTGRTAPGYITKVLASDDQLNCGGSARFASPSPVTVDAGPVACGPSVLYALACWNSPTPTLALCYQDPWQRQVVQLHTQGRLQSEPAPAKPSPLGLVLGDGTRCSLRAGGAWASLDGHPELFGTFGCQGQVAVWAKSGSDGIDRSRALWRVRLAPLSGHGQLHVMTVRTAYFVGTARS